MKRRFKTVFLLLMCSVFIAGAVAEGVWMGSFVQRGPATHELKGKGLSAAHASLPMKTKVSVTNLQNRSQVVVTITARMVPSGSRIIDVSAEAAEALGMGGKGVTAVLIEVVR